ncbi:PQQ-dependent sugar dehydrogenase [Radiobacillus kanasensis]|uniref:PQQ-dependent sugar dehydrogenase n=1 Tax=Radiobacillus kanasensis TaxID=2844358 RepID=UPI001E39EAF6|nr:PQQ-dependent sugar dehydrogenase [Radiobacillus kanasensis]UFT99785.1 PQQ-dependent sugar dehydrogenase [Radiobacillus kanasensis]
MVRFLVVVGLFMLSVGCSDQEERNREEGANSPDRMETEISSVQTIASHLEEPWEIVQFEERIYVSERNGSIVEIESNEYQRKPVELDEELAEEPEAGLLGLVIPEDFTQTNRAIAYYSYVQEGEVYQRVVAIIEREEVWKEDYTLIDQIPGGTFHQGGRIEIGPDDKLYVTTGDATEPDLAQNKESLAGKILRVNLDGSVPSDNPFPGSLIFSLGHRNPQGLAWTEGDQLYATEHGNQAHDELNRIQAGANYGWPEIEGDQGQSGMQTPIVHSGEETWAPSGLTYYDDHFYFAGLRGEAIHRYSLDQEQLDVIISGYGRIRDVLATEAGLYFITNNTDGRGNPTSEDDQLMLKRWE